MMQQVGENNFRANRYNDPKEYNKPMIGLTKREHFASLAMQGFMANSQEIAIETILITIGLHRDTPYSFEKHYPKYIAKCSVMFADALLKELEETNEAK